MKELEILLEKLWIIKEEDKELYYSIKDASPSFKEFVEEKLGYRLIINPHVIKLEKLPGRAEPWMGIQDFDDPMEYAFLCLLLVFLEDRGAGEQFVLSEITEFIQAYFLGDEKVDWTLFRHRKYIVKVLRLAVGIGLMKVDDGDEGRFMDMAETEVLYESTGISRYFMRNFTGNILNYNSPEDIENSEWLDMDRDKGRVRRNRVYRRLFMSPAVYSEGADDPDYLYIKNFRSMLQKDIEEVLGSQLHIHRNGAFVVLGPDKYFKSMFPDNRAISDIVLQLNRMIRDRLDSGELVRRDDDIITLSKLQFVKMIEECRQFNIYGWSKEYREMPVDRLVSEIMQHMTGFGMLEVDSLEREVKILPLTGKITGRYPADFTAPDTGEGDQEGKVG